jgi:nitrite reductase/ring-hydroxylating ferredoxin subunit
MTDQDRPRATGDDVSVRRRVLLRGAATGAVAVPLLAGCGGSAGGAGGAGGRSGNGSAGDSGGSGSGGATVAASAVPVGGGTILKDAEVVVTQPAKGQFKAFSAICTHQGCLVGTVQDRQIICPCHGSRFSITTGKPLSGPATTPLPPKKVSVQGGDVEVG